MDNWINRWIDEWTEGQSDEWMVSVKVGEGGRMDEFVDWSLIDWFLHYLTYY